MARLAAGEKEIDVPDGNNIMDAAEILGVPFGCRQGICSTCKTVVLEGMQNLEPKNDKEIEMGVEENERLMCQCRIIKGIVKIRV